MTSNNVPNPTSDLEEAAQGQDLYRSPGSDRQLEQAREQAEDSGWLPPDVVYDWPSADSHRRIATRRRDLYEAMQQLEASVARASGLEDWTEKVEKALANMEAALERHVEEIEAGDGLFAQVIDRAPHLSSSVDSLRQEHQSMLKQCREALDLASSGGPAPEMLRRKVVEVIELIVIHRQTGAELLFDTYNVDVGSGD
ncbi:MAG: hypothetical protein PVJ28_00425 [Acidimicrobiia bacterium]